jgi:hypothetical protein
MSFNYSPKIVTDGLVLCLDAANTKSYVSGSTAWNDLSRSGNNGTLINGPTFNPANGGSIVLDGVNDYVAITNNSFNYSPGVTGEVSVESWFNLTGAFGTFAPENITALGGVIGQGIFNGTNGYGLGIQRIGTGPYFCVFQVRNGSTVVVAVGDIILNTWNHVIGTFTRNNFSRIYINGTLIQSNSTVSLNNLSITPNINDAALGRGGGGGWLVGGNIPVGRIYNRPLSAQEVLQNYNATKGRFGL